MTKRAIIEEMSNQQIINDWLNCGINSEQELDFIENTSLFDAIFTYFEHLKSDDQVFTYTLILFSQLCTKDLLFPPVIGTDL